MGKPHWHPELLLIRRTQLRRDPQAIGRRVSAQIHRYIKNGPNAATHELALGLGRKLVMQTTQDPFARAGVIVLTETKGIRFFNRSACID